MKKLHHNLYVAGQLQRSDFEALAEQGIKTIINNRPDNEEPGQLSQAESAKLAAAHGIQYHFLPLANGQPLPEGLINDFKNILEKTTDPILAHCRSGMRSSVIWALGQITDGNITVDQAITAAQAAEIPLHNARALLESVAIHPHP